MNVISNCPVPSNLSKVMVYFPPEVKEKLQKIAQKERRSLSSMVVYIVDRFIEQQEGAEDE